MSDLSPEARALLDLDRQFGGPSPGDQARVRAAVMARLTVAAAGATIVAGTTQLAASKSSSTALSAALAKIGLAGSTGKIAGALLLGAMAGSATTTAYHQQAAARREAHWVATLASARAATPVAPPPPVPLPLTTPAEPAPPPPPEVASATTALPSEAPVLAVDGPAPGPSHERTAAPAPAPVATARSLKASASPATSASPSKQRDTIERELSLLDTSQRALRQHNPQAALDALEQHAREFPAGTLAEERDAARVVTLCSLGRIAEGRRLAASFLLARPLSPLAPRVRAACANPLRKKIPFRSQIFGDVATILISHNDVGLSSFPAGQHFSSLWQGIPLMRAWTYLGLACLLPAGLLWTGDVQADDELPPAAEAAPASPPPPAPVASPPPPPAPAPTVVSPPPATELTPAHRGFTFEFGLGFAHTYVSGAQGDRYAANRFGFAPLSVSLGGFLTPNFALTVRNTGTNIFQRGLRDLESTGMLGIAGQYFVSKDVFLGAGVGLGLLSKSRNFTRSNNYFYYEAGLAFSGRIGYAFARAKPGKNINTFSIFAEVIPGFYQSNTTLGSVVGLQWQLD